MSRPESAKINSKRYWGLTSQDVIVEQDRNTAEKVHLMKPDLTSHHFSRILPKFIYKDKEQLYSETLRLKQNLNEVKQENMMLKTRINKLKSKRRSLTGYVKISPEALPTNNSGHFQLSCNKESILIQNLKNKIQDLHQQNDFLKAESLKIKHTIKYTSLNELQIEVKIISNQNKKLSKLLRDAQTQIKKQEDLIQQNQQIQKYLQQEMKANQQLSQENQKYDQIVSNLEEQLKSEIEKYQAKINSLQRNLALEKRRALEHTKYFDDLRKQISHLQNQIRLGQSKQEQVQSTRRSSGRNRYKNSMAYKSSRPSHNQLTITTEQINKTNEQLENELKQINQKLQQSEKQLKQRIIRIARVNQTAEEQNHKKVQVPIDALQNHPIQSKKDKQLRQEAGELIKKEPEFYFNQFQNIQEVQVKTKLQTNKGYEQINNIKKQSEHNQNQQQISKQESPQKERKKQPYKRKNNQKSAVYKQNKQILYEIKQILTYRMKSQRYPFQDLKIDIQSSESHNFSYIDLHSMLINEPFYLTSNYAQIFLLYCYNKDKIQPSETLDKSILLSKLRKVIEDFQLLEQDQQKEMMMRVVHMASSYPQQLHTAFSSIKNGEDTVSKKDLIDMFKNLELEDQYIQIIIAELSLCSDDLQHLNFMGFFERFYIENQSYQKSNAISEQGQESQESYHHPKATKQNKTTQQFYEEEPQQKIGLYIPPSQQMDKPAFNDDDNIVSDD